MTTPLYHVSQWPDRRRESLPLNTWTFPLRADAEHQVGLLDGLNLILEWFAQDTTQPRWLSVGGIYTGTHCLDGFHSSNALHLQYAAGWATAVGLALPGFGHHAITMKSREKKGEQTTIVIIPLDGEITSSSDFKRLSSMPVEDLRLQGWQGGDNCTFIFHADPSELAQAQDSESIYSTDNLTSGQRTCLENWKA